jgi:uncharacterized protein involved in outer membrane biogenesis
LDRPQFGQYDYPGTRIGHSPTVIDTTKQAVTAPPWQFNITQLLIKNGNLSIDRKTEHQPYVNQFDGQHFQFYAIDAKLDTIQFQGSAITAHLQLAAKEKSGLAVQKLETKLNCDASMMEFNQLDLQTNKSHIGNYYAMRYEDFNEDMSAFLHRIIVEAHFNRFLCTQR